MKNINLTLAEVNDLPILQHIDNKTNIIDLDIWGVNEIMGIGAKYKNKILHRMLAYTCNEEPLFVAFRCVGETTFGINPHIYNNGIKPNSEKFLNNILKVKGGLG